jgi:CrcB protein
MPLLENSRIPSNVITGLICVVLGSALGGSARYFLSGFVARRVGETFPWGTLLVNVSGALLIGILGALAEDDASPFASPNPWLFAVTGFLGCYTTVSSFSLQTLSLARDGEGSRAFGYVAISVALSLGAVAAGFALVGLLR